jgi:HSP20 family protein
MAQTEWDPLKDLVGIQERMNKLFESALARTNFDAEGGVGAWTPVADVHETDTGMVFCLELPGLSQSDIDVRLEDDELVVRGERQMDRPAPGEQFHRVERSYGKFVRRFPLRSHIDRASVSAVYQDGVLAITIAKKKEDDGKTPIRVAIR